MEEKVISLQNVSFKRNGKEILKNINWDIKENEHWALLGLNGSGKTSLLNIVSGYHFPSSGDVSVLGNVFGRTSLPELRKQIGFVSTATDRFSNVYDLETVEEIVVSGKFASFGLYEKVEQEDWEKADQLLSRFRLDYLKGKVFHQLSQGEKRRVFIARAFMNQPSLVILDEPCAGLDILSREEVLDLTDQIAKTDCHVIYVTHYIEEIVQEISHVLLLRDGKMVAAGPKHDVLTDTLLTETFKTNVKVHWEEDRPWLSIQKND